jgi:hypothetical protein
MGRLLATHGRSRNGGVVAAETTETLGMSAQLAICEEFGLDPGRVARRANPRLVREVRGLLPALRRAIGSSPSRIETFETPHDRASRHVNFVLKDGRTLRVKTSRNERKGMVCPPVVGQPGTEAFDQHFGHLYEGSITASRFKRLVNEGVSEMMPILVDHLFSCDWTAWIFRQADGRLALRVFKRGDIAEQDWDQRRFSFSCPLERWNESCTIKYDGVSIAEAQVHRNRSGYKFRFNLGNLLPLILRRRQATEQLGVSAELATCLEFGLAHPGHLVARADQALVAALRPVIREAFREIGPPSTFTGADPGARGGASKSAHDFVLNGGATVSLKTNLGKRVCPPEVGQPGRETFLVHFGELLDVRKEDFDAQSFKRLCLTRTAEMFRIYLHHLLTSDYLVWIKRAPGGLFGHRVLRTARVRGYEWEQEDFTFSQDARTWNESCSVRYRGVAIGSFQLHGHRSSYKFRFDFVNLLTLLVPA